MSTKALVEKIYRRSLSLGLKTTWARNSGEHSILKLIEEGQDALLDGYKEGMIWIGNENQGFPPYLKTTEGVYSYEITANNLKDVTSVTFNVGGSNREVRAKQVLSVFVDSSCRGYNTLPYPQSPGSFSWYDPYSFLTRQRRIISLNVDAFEALEDTPARIMFKADPGTTDTRYFVAFTWEAPRLTSESISLVIPRSFEKYLIDYAIGNMLEHEGHVNNTHIQRFENIGIYEYKRTRREGAHVDDFETPLRIC